MSDYRLQVINARTGHVVRGWQPGDKVELDLVDDLVERVKRKGLGMFPREAKVLAVVRESFDTMLYELKERV